MTAYLLHAEGFTDITVMAESFEGLTSHTAGGLWAPSTQLGEKNDEQEALYKKVLRDSLDFYRNVIRDPNNALHSAVGITPLYARQGMAFMKEVAGFYANPENVSVRFGNSNVTREMVRYNDAVFMQVFKYMILLRMPLGCLGLRHLSILDTHLERDKGIKFEQKRITSLFNDTTTRVVINCAGLGARELTGDQELHPVLGNMLYTNNEPNASLNYMILYNTKDTDAPKSKFRLSDGGLILYFPKITDLGRSVV